MTTSTDVVTNFAPVVRDDCGDVFWSHPAFTGGFGDPSGYLVYVNGGDAQPYTPGTEIQVASDGAEWSVTLKATYATQTFEHQLGQHKGVGEVCVVIPPKPDPEFSWWGDEPVEDCDTGEVTVTLTEHSAGYWWSDDAGEWLLGDWFPTGNVETQVIHEAVCDVPVDDEPAPDNGSDDGDDEPAAVIPDDIVPDELPPVDDLPELPETVAEVAVQQPTPPVLAETGISDVASPMLGLVLVAAGLGAVAVGKLVRR